MSVAATLQARRAEAVVTRHRAPAPSGEHPFGYPSGVESRKESVTMRWGQLRRAVLERDDYTCQYCGHRPDRLQIVVPFFGDVVRRGTLHVDHITPRAQGGLDVIENLVTACESCNLRKNANTWPAPIAYCIDCRVLHRDLEVTTLGPCGPEWCCSDCLATVAEDND